MALGNAKNIIVGAGALYIGAKSGEELTEDTLPGNPAGVLSGYAKTLTDPANVNTGVVGAAGKWQSVGYTSEGADLSFEPDFGEVQVDQLLDVAKIFKQGQKVMVKTTLTEATLENFIIVLGAAQGDMTGSNGSSIQSVVINGGALGYSPIERSIAIVGPGPDSKNDGGSKTVERVYVGYRALSMESVSVGIKRNEATVFPVTFRLLASSGYTQGGNATYGKVIDRVFTAA